MNRNSESTPRKKASIGTTYGLNTSRVSGGNTSASSGKSNPDIFNSPETCEEGIGPKAFGP